MQARGALLVESPAQQLAGATARVPTHEPAESPARANFLALPHRGLSAGKSAILRLTFTSNFPLWHALLPSTTSTHRVGNHRNAPFHRPLTIRTSIIDCSVTSKHHGRAHPQQAA